MTSKTLLVAASLTLFAGCELESSDGLGSPGSRCQPVCQFDTPCGDLCEPLGPGRFELAVVGAITAGDYEPPDYQVFTTDRADPVLASETEDVTSLEIDIDISTQIIVALPDDTCVFPAVSGVLTCTTDRHELSLALR